MNIFREEVYNKKPQNLDGVINLAQPMSWIVISSFMFALLAMMLIATCFIEHEKIVKVRGQIVPSSGVSEVRFTRGGIIENVYVKDGQDVIAGQPIAKIRVEETNLNGSSAQSKNIASLNDQLSSLLLQKTKSHIADTHDLDRLSAQISGLKKEIYEIDSQIEKERRLVDIAKEDLESAKVVAQRGFISRRDISSREETFLTREQQLANLRQAKASKESSILEVMAALAAGKSRALSANALLSQQKFQIERQQTEEQSVRGYLLTAPRSGKVTALNLKVGDPAEISKAGLMIVPIGDIMIAEFAIPIATSGFIEVGDKIRMSLDAFPYQKYGSISGNIVSISNAPVLQLKNSSRDQFSYVGIASIDKPHLALLRKKSIRAGMTFDARIVLEKKTIISWFFDSFRQDFSNRW